MELTDLFYTETILKEVNSLDKSLMEKMALIEQFDKIKKLLSIPCSMLSSGRNI